MKRWRLSPCDLGPGTAGERRAQLLDELRVDLGATSIAELIRKLIDSAATARGLTAPGDLRLDLASNGPPSAGLPLRPALGGTQRE